MTIVLNGTAKDFESPLNLKSLIEHYCKNPKYVIAELNGSVIKSQEWTEKELRDGDILELVNFVGGG